MSTFKRLLPAPPQVRMHGELINQLMVMIPAQSLNITIIEPIYRQEIQRNKNGKTIHIIEIFNSQI